MLLKFLDIIYGSARLLSYEKLRFIIVSCLFIWVNFIFQVQHWFHYNYFQPVLCQIHKSETFVIFTNFIIIFPEFSGQHLNNLIEFVLVFEENSCICIDMFSVIQILSKNVKLKPASIKLVCTVIIFFYGM